LTKAKEVFRLMVADGRGAGEIIRTEGLAQTDDESALRRVIEDLLRRHPDELNRYRSGKKNLFGFFMGEAMKAMDGTANPKVLNRLLQEMLQA
jgi:aspartyl-tRNA(Asn)/glutamyl-tRNA(Gln) amidotransferase subunit B